MSDPTFERTAAVYAMTIDELVRQLARSNLSASTELVDTFCRQEHLQFTEFSDQFARHVATGYHQGQIAWLNADSVMNRLDGLAAGYACNGRGWLSDFAHSVYLAFDAGEYHPLTPHLGADEVTRPLIADLLAG